MNREVHVRICGGGRVRFPPATRRASSAPGKNAASTRRACQLPDTEYKTHTQRLSCPPSRPSRRVRTDQPARLMPAGCRDHGGMTDRDLIRRAEALGVSVSYLDWRKRRVQADPEVLNAILGALGDSGNPVADLAPGSAAGPESASGPRSGPVSGPRSCPASGPRSGSGRSWGFTVQLYSVRSRCSWGHGDLRDLADIAVWSARELGAGFILVNPLHAAEPEPPVSPSPYLPMTRRFTSPLYLRIEDIPEYQQLTEEQREHIDKLAASLRARNTASDLIERD